MNFVRRTINKINLKDVSVCPMIMSNNENEIFSNQKDRRELNCKVNASFTVRCLDCCFCKRMYTDSFDIERTILYDLNDGNSEISIHCRTHDHRINLRVESRDITQFDSKEGIRRAKNVTRYL